MLELLQKNLKIIHDSTKIITKIITVVILKKAFGWQIHLIQVKLNKSLIIFKLYKS